MGLNNMADVNLTSPVVSNFLIFNGTNWVNAPASIAGGSHANYTNNTTTLTMGGLGCSITPTRSGIVIVNASFVLSSSVAGDGAQWQLNYGTGAAPTNGGTLIGTSVSGSILQIETVNATTDLRAKTISGYIAGLTMGTTYWIDLATAVWTGGVATFSNVRMFAFEI